MKKRLRLIALILVLALLLTAAVWPGSLTIWLKPQQSVMVRCDGDELIVTPYSDTEMEVTCRVWVRR